MEIIVIKLLRERVKVDIKDKLAFKHVSALLLRKSCTKTSGQLRQVLLTWLKIPVWNPFAFSKFTFLW